MLLHKYDLDSESLETGVSHIFHILQWDHFPQSWLQLFKISYQNGKCLVFA